MTLQRSSIRRPLVLGVGIALLAAACSGTPATSPSSGSGQSAGTASVVPASASAQPASAGTTACTPGTTKKIAFMLKQQAAFRYLNADIPFFKKTAEAAGYQVLVQSAENDAQKQLSQAENVLTQGVDAIVIQPVDFNVAGQIADKAASAGIPLASYDDMILNAKHAAFIGRDPKAGGAEAATTVTAKVPKGNYVIIGGDAGQTGSTTMSEGYHSVLDPLVQKGDIKIVMDQFTPGWKTEPAQANAENALTANANNVQAFLSSYDGMTVGILQAIKQARIPDGKILVTGQDMELQAMQAIAEGRQFGSLWPAPEEMAAAGAKAAIALATCQPVGATKTINNGAADIPFVETPIFLVTGDTLADFACKHTYWQKLDDVYKNAAAKKPTC